ncbi:MAG: OsmC family protein [Gemmatimonadetes bacterium]|nr:OsmC family protein [Gemmatimonadota bacterium]
MADNVRTAVVEWLGGMRFRGGAPGGTPIMLDADGAEGPGPMVSLLVAVAGCTGADVVSILAKMQVALETYRMTVSGVRAEEHPKRYRSIVFQITLGGRGLDETKARRAIDLSIEKYCSVLHSLNPDIAVSYELVLLP